MAKSAKRSFDTFVDEDLTSPPHEQPLSINKPSSRSCKTCYERKIRCDRAVPCANCAKGGLSCVYPVKEKDTPRKGSTLQIICDRLIRIETLLSRCLEHEQDVAERTLDAPRIRKGQKPDRRAPVETAVTSTHQYGPSEPTSPATWQLLLDDKTYAGSSHDHGLVAPEDERQRPQSAHGAGQTAIQRFSLVHDIHSTFEPHPKDTQRPQSLPNELDYYPDAKLALQLWNVYIKSVDPVVKILHIPSIQSAIVSTILDPKSSPRSMVALTYAIYFASVTAFSYHGSNELDDERLDTRVLLQRFRQSLDKLLLSTDSMNSPTLITLQALTIYATCLRVHDVGRSVWVLNGLAIRLAQSMGLDRDSAGFSLNPFETEMRLRLWWHLCVLDSRGPEDQGFQPTVDITNRHLRLPLNVNDNQLYPEMAELPSESTEWTEMSFFLIQTDSCRILFPILDVRDPQHADPLSDIKEKRALLAERSRSIAVKYGIHSGLQTSDRMFRIAEQHSTTARLKMEFMLQLREEMTQEMAKKKTDSRMPETHKRSFELACQTLESNYILWKDDLTSHFKWFFRTYTQWYALAYVLRCLCSCSTMKATDRAWFLVNELLPRQSILNGDLIESCEGSGPTNISSFLCSLYSRAMSLREQVSEPAPGLGTEAMTMHLPELLDSHPSSHGADMPGDGFSQSKELFSNDETLMASDNPREGSCDFLDQPGGQLPFLPDSDWDAVMRGWLEDENNQLNAF